MPAKNSKARERFRLPRVFKGIDDPHRFKVFFGGRGSAKSWTVARVLLLRAYNQFERVLCAREIQASMNDSVIKLLADQIEALGLAAFFVILRDRIICKRTGSEFLFKGLRHNVHDIKSTEGVTICWVEEAQRVSQDSWDVLIPTIRQPNSEIWITFNPENEKDPTYQRFIARTPPNALVRKVNWTENPWFPDVLREEMEYCKTVDYDAYLHIWEGYPKRLSAAIIFSGKYVIEEFDTDALTPERFFFGADWGFAQDPTVLTRTFIIGRTLYVDHEAYGVGVEIDEIPTLFRTVPLADRYCIKGDNSRPETISAVSRAGLNVQPAAKWQGSVEDGIAHLRGFDRIVIHPRCKHTADEFGLYSYKVDRVTEEVLPIVVDKHNHCIDSIRYGLDGYINKRTTGLIDHYQREHGLLQLAMKEQDENTY